MIAHRKNTGFSMIEVLITIVILMIGLLGLAGLQTKALTAQMEAYQRSQALILLKDMASRIEANRINADHYLTYGTPRGTGFNSSAVLDCSGLAGSNLDLCEWHNALLGAAETQSGANVGAMIGARGCITRTVALATGVPAQYLIAVAWQGLNSTAAPSTTVAQPITCGTGQYKDTTGTVNEALRRVVALPVNIAYLL